MNWEEESRKVRKLEARAAYLRQTLAEEERLLRQAKQAVTDSQQAQEILQHLAQAIQQQAHRRIADVVTTCLRTVFGDTAYTFKIEFERKRGRTEARLRFLRGELDIDPISASGGGMIDVAAFGLRAACLMLHRPRLSRLLVLDEPFKFVSAAYRDNVRQMLEELSSKLDLQIVMVTHEEAYETGTVFQL